MSSGRWLTTREQRAWRAYLAATRLLSARLDRELVREAQLPHAYYEILVRLSEAPGRRLRMSQLADAADSSRSRLSHAVARLEDAGWVARELCATDRRGAVARLTDAGFDALAAAAPGHADAVRTYVFDLLTPEQVDQLRDICELISEGLRRGEPAAAGCDRAAVCPGSASADGRPGPELCETAPPGPRPA